MEKMHCWELVNALKRRKVLHTKYVLQKKRDVKENLNKYNAISVVCGNEESNDDEDFFHGGRFLRSLYDILLYTT